MVKWRVSENHIVGAGGFVKESEDITLNQSYRIDIQYDYVFPSGICQYFIPLDCSDIGASKGGEFKADTAGA